MPVSAFYGACLFGLRASHAALNLEAVVDTRSVADDERRAFVGFGLAECLEALCLVGAHCNLCNVNVSVGGLHEAEVFLGNAFAACSELCDSTDRRSLRSLAAGVGVNLGVEHEDVHVFARSKHVVETSVAYVVACTVAADNPMAALGEVVLHFGKLCTFLAFFLVCLDERYEFFGCSA